MTKNSVFILSEPFRFILGGIIFISAIMTDVLCYSSLSFILYLSALTVSGFSVYVDAVKGILRRDFLDEKFLMSIASIGAMIIGEYTEGVAVMIFFLLGEMFEHKAVSSSRKKIKSLLAICPDEATVIRDGKESVIDADDVVVGDIVIIKSGERVAVDAVVISGAADVDASAITGESIPYAAGEGSHIESGSIVIGGALVCRAERESSESSAVRILDMVENASENKAREESFITSFSKIYTPAVVSLAITIAIIPSLFGFTEWSESVYRALIFLVISCPCALVISVPMAFFAGIGAAASKGILYKGGNSFSPVAKTKTIAFDKTGTLTGGEFSVVGIKSVGISESELLAYAAAVEQYSNHPIARSIQKNADFSTSATDVKELAGRGVIGKVYGKNVAVGNEKLMAELSVIIPEDFYVTDNSVLFVAIDNLFSGVVEISDNVKAEAEKALKMLRKVGISKTIIMSGDKSSRVNTIASKLDIDCAYSELLPEDKYRILKKEIDSQNGKVMYVGDGINDAPALTLADVGVAMGGVGSDSAIECADLVITSDNLERLSEAVIIARRTLRIAKENIVFALGVKMAILVLSAFGVANMWLAVFADVGVAVLAILNSMRNLIISETKK